MGIEGITPAGDGEARPLRIERGAAVIGADDGMLGTVVQVVMDRRTPGLRAIIVRPTDSGRELEIAAAHVLSADGDEVRVDFGRAQMTTDPTLAGPYDPDQYVAVDKDVGVPPGRAAHLASATDQPVVTRLEDDAVEVVAPAHDAAPRTPRTPAVPSVRDLSVDWQAPGNIATVRPLRGEREASDGITPASVTSPDAEELLDSPTAGVSAAELAPRRAEPTPPPAPSIPAEDVSRISKKEYAGMKDTGDQSFAAQTTPTARQKAQQAAKVPPADTYLEGGTIPPEYQLLAPRGIWTSPWVLGAGSAALIAGTTAAALWWRRGMVRSKPSDWRSLANDQIHGWRATGSDQLHAWRGTTSDQLDAWRAMLDKQLHLWRKQVAPQLNRNARLLSKSGTAIAQREAARHASNAAASLAAAAAIASKQLDAWRATVGDSLRSGSKMAVRGPRMAVKRTQIGARWFGRGAVVGAPLGVIGGLFIAPVTGRQLRDQVWGWIKQGRTQAMGWMETYRTRRAGTPRDSMTAGPMATDGKTTTGKMPPSGETLTRTGPIR